MKINLLLKCLKSQKIIMDNNQQKHIKLANNYYSKVRRKSLKAHFQLQQMSNQLNKSYKWMPCVDCLARCNRFQREFKRAFETLSYTEQAQLFYNYSYSTYNILFNVPEIKPNTSRFKKAKFYVLNAANWQWQLKQVELDKQEMVLSLVKQQISINLCNYIFRTSKNRQKQAIALQSTSKFQYILTLRLSNSEGTFQAFRTQIKSVMLIAMKERISKQLGTQIINQQLSLDGRLSQKFSVQKSLSINQGNYLKRNNTKDQPKVNDLTETEKAVENYGEIKKQFLQFNKQNCEKIQRDFLFDPIDKIFRKEFQIDIDQKMILENCIQQHFLNQKLFHEWKPSLINAYFISQRQQIKIFHEKHKIAQKIFEFKYSRTKFYENNCFLFYDRPQYIQNVQSLIKYCIFKIQSSVSSVKIIQQCRFYDLNDEASMLEQAICLFGDFGCIKKNKKMNKLEIISNSNDFQNQLSQIQQISDSIHQYSFYSISENNRQSFNSESLGKQRENSNRYLYVKHPTQPFDKSNLVDQQYLITKKDIQEKQFIVDSDRGLIVKIEARKKNQNKIQNQYHNITLNEKDSNLSPKSALQSVCYSLTFAPLLLELMVKNADPIKQFAFFSIFILTETINSLKTNNISQSQAGETYQAWIDGCPVYGQQLSHSPSISAFLLKGRGYDLFGTSQIKFSLREKSYSKKIKSRIIALLSLNRSQLICKYDQQIIGQFRETQIKYTIKGENTFIDSKNKLFLRLNFGQNKNILKREKSDIFQGQIMRTKQSPQYYLDKQIKLSEILQKCGKIKGGWTQKILFNQQLLFNPQTEFPFKIIPQKFCLQSPKFSDTSMK